VPLGKPAFQPYWGKLAVRNDRGDRGNVGIIRSPIRASILPDHSGHGAVHRSIRENDRFLWWAAVNPGYRRHYATRPMAHLGVHALSKF
jgi:hypothetical protein